MQLHVTDDRFLDLANKLAHFTGGFKIIDKPYMSDDIYLRLDDIGLAVVSSLFKPLYVKEIYAKLILRFQNLRDELIIQAIKIPAFKSTGNTHGGNSISSPDCKACIWDLTAGLGKDAFIMASAGYSVTMVEQNPILATIVYYALEHNILPTRNLNLIYANSLEFIQQQSTRPNIIYLDPMFSDNSAAKSKKEMQLIAALAGNLPVQNNIDLFAASVKCALNKVVVKRDNKQEYLVTTPQPTYTKSGKTIRFDIYNLTG